MPSVLVDQREALADTTEPTDRLISAGIQNMSIIYGYGFPFFSFTLSFSRFVSHKKVCPRILIIALAITDTIKGVNHYQWMADNFSPKCGRLESTQPWILVLTTDPKFIHNIKKASNSDPRENQICLQHQHIRLNNVDISLSSSSFHMVGAQ